MHKILTTSLIIGGLTLATTAAHAQAKVSIGPVVGETLMKQHLDNNTELTHRFGLVAGAQAYVSWGRFALQPALLFSQKGFKYSTQVIAYPTSNGPGVEATYSTTMRLNYLTLPLNFTFAPAGTATGPQFFAGPYVSMLLGGTVDQSELAGQPASTTAIRVANEADFSTGPTMRRLDTGLQAGLGFRYNSLLLQASYSLGLSNIRPTFTNLAGGDTKAYNRGFQVNIGYLFDLKH